MRTVEFIFRYSNGIEAGRFKHPVEELPVTGDRVSFHGNQAKTVCEYWDDIQEFEVRKVLQVVQLNGECDYQITVKAVNY